MPNLGAKALYRMYLDLILHLIIERMQLSERARDDLCLRNTRRMHSPRVRE